MPISVRSLRVFVEAVEVELDEDDGLLWTSLQTAFPGCSGMYYRDREIDCRSSVKFDGKKFRPPGGAWNDRQYYVTLSQRCHTTSQPFGSYENASKQFERSVNAVQKMLGGAIFDLPSRPQRDKASSPDSGVEKTLTTITSDPAASMQEREHFLKSAGRRLSPIEQQFIDLAKISTGKDTIIEQNREEIKKLGDQIQEQQRVLKTTQDRCSDFESQVTVQEEELNMLRKMSSDQTYMGGKVNELTNRILNKENELARVREILEEQVRKTTEELREAREKNSTLSLQLQSQSQKIVELREQVQLALVSKQLLSKELDQLRPLADVVDLSSSEKVPTYIEAINKSKKLEEEKNKADHTAEELRSRYDDLNTMNEKVTRDNTLLYDRNFELEKRINQVDSELRQLNQEWKEQMIRKEKELETIRYEADIECDSMKKQISDLQRVLEAVSRDASENSRRAEELQKSRDGLQRAIDTAEMKSQEPLYKEIRTLSSDLQEAERRISELTGLVAFLTSDVQDSQRDISHML
uniref:TDP43_N domain-containing protein n=1 Tax=Heterorhabditis bacteriophora TaxID=37862 RepID=A0A1I7XU86_HETBA